MWTTTNLRSWRWPLSINSPPHTCEAHEKQVAPVRGGSRLWQSLTMCTSCRGGRAWWRRRLPACRALMMAEAKTSGGQSDKDPESAIFHDGDVWPPEGRRHANTLTRTIKSNGVCPGAVVEGVEVLEGRGAELAEEYGSTPVVLSVMAPNTHRW